MDRDFVHAAEAEVAAWLDGEGIRWQYEPHTFVLEHDGDGNVLEAVTPDFYLPEVDAYLEVTTMRQSLTTRKNRKVRLLNERHGVVATIVYARDLDRLRALTGANEVPARPFRESWKRYSAWVTRQRRRPDG